jgi:hypothetical protein
MASNEPLVDPRALHLSSEDTPNRELLLATKVDHTLAGLRSRMSDPTHQGASVSLWVGRQVAQDVTLNPN